MVWVDYHAGLDDVNAFSRLLAGIRGHAPGPGPRSTAESSLPADSTSNPAPTIGLTVSQRKRQEVELARLQAQYDTSSNRLTALDTEIGHALDNEHKLVLEELALILEPNASRSSVKWTPSRLS
jgi:hypothetical protein